MNTQLDRLDDVRIALVGSPRSATGSRVRLAGVAARAFVLGCTVAVLLTTVHDPSPISLLLDGAAVIAAALASF